MGQLKRGPAIEPFPEKDGQKGRTAYQETAPASNLEQAQLLGSRDRVFSILSPVARSVAVQEVDFVENFYI